MKALSHLGLVLSCLLAMDVVASEISLSVGPTSTSQVKLASQRLERYLRKQSSDAGGRIIVARLDESDLLIGEEGYKLSSRESKLYVHANSEAGLANGIYTLLRTLMIEDLASPFERSWDVCDKPCFRWRSMMVAPYNFGAAHGFSVFSPDMWAGKHWRQYLDYLRLLNINVVGIYSMRLYDPAIPETWPNRQRYAIWKEAMDYAHDLGMQFTWVQTANLVHQETWWRHPELRNEHEIGWQGCALCYSKARTLIRKTQRHTFEHFKEADHFMLMFSDGGGACYCDQCSKDQAGVFLEMVKDAKQTLGDVGSKADVIFWNWALDWWYESFPAGIPGYLERYPETKDIQKELYARLPKDVPFEDVAAIPKIFPKHKTDTLKEAKTHGFETTIAFAYGMNPELPAFMLPQPRINPMIQMLRYAKTVGVDGVDGYRLAPCGRILNDFVFARLAWDPDISGEQLVGEMAGYLTEDSKDRAKVNEAISALDAYWEGKDQIANIDKAARLFDEAKQGEPPYQLEYTADMVSLLPGIHRLNQPVISKQEADAIKARLFAETSKRYILQGFGGTDYQWVPEARMYFDAFVRMWAPRHQQTPPATDTEESK